MNGRGYLVQVNRQTVITLAETLKHLMVDRFRAKGDRTISLQRLGAAGMPRLETEFGIPTAVGEAGIAAWGIGLAIARIGIDRHQRADKALSVVRRRPAISGMRRTTGADLAKEDRVGKSVGHVTKTGHERISITGERTGRVLLIVGSIDAIRVKRCAQGTWAIGIARGTDPCGAGTGHVVMRGQLGARHVASMRIAGALVDVDNDVLDFDGVGWAVYPLFRDGCVALEVDLVVQRRLLDVGEQTD